MTSFAQWLEQTPMLVGRKFQTISSDSVYTITACTGSVIDFKINSYVYIYKYTLNSKGNLVLTRGDGGYIPTKWV